MEKKRNNYKQVKAKGISKKTLKMIDGSIKNYKKGKVGKPIDLSEWSD